jgi:hypothetical protein
LTRRGKPYNRPAFYHHWNKLFAPAQHQFKKGEHVEFTAHDLRHLRVTRTVTKLRKDAKGDAATEAALLEGFQHLIGKKPLQQERNGEKDSKGDIILHIGIAKTN